MKKTLEIIRNLMLGAVVALAIELRHTNERLAEESDKGFKTESMVVLRADREKALEARVAALEARLK
jgi:hypothetical protein